MRRTLAVALASVVLLAGIVALVSLLVFAAGPRTAAAVPAGTVPAGTGLPRATPVSLDIPAIAAHSTLIPLGLDQHGALQVPPVRTPMQAGWFTGAPTPGEVGPAVIVGHVDGNRQQGIFSRLDELRPGDAIVVRRADRRAAGFTVQRIERVPKARFPTQRVYGNIDAPGLRLITCGGSFDAAAHSYRDNVIVYATLQQR